MEPRISNSSTILRQSIKTLLFMLYSSLMILSKIHVLGQLSETELEKSFLPLVSERILRKNTFLKNLARRMSTSIPSHSILLSAMNSSSLSIRIGPIREVPDIYPILHLMEQNTLKSKQIISLPIQKSAISVFSSPETTH